MKKISNNIVRKIATILYEVLSISTLAFLFIIAKDKGTLFFDPNNFRWAQVNFEFAYAILTLLIPLLIAITYFKLFDSRIHVVYLAVSLFVNTASYHFFMTHGCTRDLCGFLITDVLILMIYFFYSNYCLLNRFGDYQEELNNNKTTLAVTSSTISLGQMKPHFMYNTLNTIKYLITEDPERAEYAIDKFSSYLRTNMNAIAKTSLIPFEEELSHIKNYVDIEKLRFEDRVKVTYKISEKGFFVPPLSVQPLVENAIKHGITKKASGGHITISTNRVGDNYVIEVKDDGVGFDITQLDKESPSIALGNIKKRIATIHGASFSITSSVGVGTTCTIIIPASNQLR